MTYILSIAAALVILLSPTHAQAPKNPANPLEIAMTGLTEQQARAVIAPWYSLFNVASRGDVKTIQEQILTEDYESCAGYLPGECWGRETSIKVVSNFANTIPDMKFDIKEVLVAGDRVIVRGEVTGTPAGDLFGVPHGGKSFRIMAVDIHPRRQDRQNLPHGELAQRDRPAPREIGADGAAKPRRKGCFIAFRARLPLASRSFGR
jgi:hypothetical protein